MAKDGASGVDRSDNDKSPDRSSKSERAERDVSEKSRDTLSGSDTTTKERDRPATPEDRAAGQERMAAAGQAAKARTEQEIRKAGLGTPSSQTETSAAAETAPGTDPTLTEVPQVDPETLPQTLREQMVAEAGGATNLEPPQQKAIDDFLASPEGIEAARQYEFARGLQVSGLDSNQTIEAMAHFNAGREVAFDAEGRIQLDNYGRVQLTEPIAYADSGQIMTDALTGPTATETLVEYARGLNNAVEQVANSNFAWAAGVAFQGLALAAGGPVRFAISQGAGWAVGQVAENAIGWAAGEIADRSDTLTEADVAELAIAGGTILGSIAGVVTWRSIRNELFDDVSSLRLSVADVASVRRIRSEARRVLEDALGPPPAGMHRPHTHHILFLRGRGPEQQALVLEGREILQRYGIDPDTGIENLTWAPNGNGVHTTARLQALVDDLREVADERTTNRDVIAGILATHGSIAADS